jgi:hypothetical protein
MSLTHRIGGIKFGIIAIMRKKAILLLTYQMKYLLIFLLTGLGQDCLQLAAQI